LDIDQRNSILSNYLKGRSNSPGRVDKIATLSEFDEAVRSAYVQTFLLKRKYGLLDISTLMYKWLGFKNYAPTKYGSAFAMTMGQRDWEAHCYKFFLDSEGNACLRYRANELTDIWLPTKDKPPIMALSPEAPTSIQEILDMNPTIKEPKEWTESEAIKKNILRDKDMSSEQRQEWLDFFDTIPTVSSDFNTQDCFTWTLPQIYAKKQKWFHEIQVIQDDMETTSTFIPHEILVHPGHTQAELNKEKRQMIAEKLAKDAAETEKAEARKMSERAMKARSGVETTSVCGNSVLSIGDFVVFSPDDDSRNTDRSSGYNLGLNIGRITSLNENLVEVWWYYSKTWDGDWIPWKCPKKKTPYKEWVSNISLLENDNGCVIRPEMIPCRRKRGAMKFSKDSLKLLQDLSK